MVAGQLVQLSGTVQPRSFTSRHVPAVVEELTTELENIAQAANALPSGQRQLQGLLAHLKEARTGCSASAERQKRAMATDALRLVPEEFEQLLRAEFERRCGFGDRSNTEHMNSAKWKKLLQECGTISGLHGFNKVNCQRTAGTVTLATADVVFQKVLRDGEYGSKRLNYNLFCKALLLVAQQAYPNLDDPAAFTELLAQVAACADRHSESNAQPEDHVDLLLDPNVVMTLDNFKPALYDLFRTVCGQNLDNPMQARGLGTIRMREHTFLKYASTQGTTTRASVNMTVFDRELASRERSRRQSVSSHGTSDSTCEPDSCKDCGIETLRAGSEQSDAENEGLTKHFVGDGMDEVAMDKVPVPVLTDSGIEMEAQPDTGLNAALGSAFNTRGGSNTFNIRGQANTDDEVSYMNMSYINGAPTVDDRCRRMSIDQMMFMCTRLGMVPDFVTRLEVVSIFKRAQHTGFSQGQGSSLHGYISCEEFVDAVGQLALRAYSKQPYTEEHPEAPDKVEAFLLRILPSNQRDLLEMFQYGRQ